MFRQIKYKQLHNKKMFLYDMIHSTSPLSDNTIIFKDDSVELVFHDSSELDFKKFVNWSKNRPVDPVRVQQIKEYYVNNAISLIPGIVSCWIGSENNVYAIYDGMHRFSALKEIVSNGQKNLKILILYKKTRKEQEIIDDFINLNKGICVPSIYLEDTDILKKTVCQNIAETLCKKYPTFVSPSRKPFMYNFNRDNLVEFISTWNINFSKSGIQDLIIHELLQLNQEAKAYVQKMGIEYPKKCKFHDFFLFYLDKMEIKRRMENLLQ